MKHNNIYTAFYNFQKFQYVWYIIILVNSCENSIGQIRQTIFVLCELNDLTVTDIQLRGKRLNPGTPKLVFFVLSALSGLGRNIECRQRPWSRSPVSSVWSGFSGLQETCLVTFSGKGLSQGFRSMLDLTGHHLHIGCSVTLRPKDWATQQAACSTSTYFSKHWDITSISAYLLESIVII